MASTTSIGKSVQQYTEEQLAEARKAQQAALEAGYPQESLLTQAYYAGIPSLYMYGDPEQMQALQRMGDLYGAYGAAGGYNKTQYGDIADLYRRAAGYDKTQYGDIEKKYAAAGQYAPTSYADIEAQAALKSKYTPGEFTSSDYTTRNIQERMSPYEELVAKRQKNRLERAYQEGRGQRELEGIRSGTFGGSGQAIRDELARRDYMSQLEDVNAQSLQAAYESAVGLYGREVADRMAAESERERSRQFAQQAGMTGLEAIFAARQAQEASRQFGKETEFEGLKGTMSARELQAAQTAAAKEAELAGIRGIMDTRGAEAAQTAAAKEAEFAGLAGQTDAAARQAALAEQRKNLQIANLAAAQAGGQQQQGYQLARTLYPLDIATAGANIGATAAGNIVSNLPSTKPDQPSTWQNVLGGATAIGGLAQGLGGWDGIKGIGSAIGGAFGFAGGGVVPYGAYNYRGGGLADLEPEYYDSYER